jgi:FdrA protein
VGGSTCLQALRALDSEITTDVIVLISKPPAARVRHHVIGIAERMPKPVVTILLGERPPTPADGNVHYAHILDEAARIAGELAGTRASFRWRYSLPNSGSSACTLATR